MKKVINITLGGIIFAIEQDAYDTLTKYLEDIKQNLGRSDDYAEITEDIEGALAEKFLFQKKKPDFYKKNTIWPKRRQQHGV